MSRNYFLQLPFTKKAPHIAAVIARDLCRGRMMATKLNYVCLLRNYFAYSIEHGEDPIKPYIDPVVAIHWQYGRTMRLGSCNSHKSWSATLSWWIWLCGAEKQRFWEHSVYSRVKKVMVKLYLIPRKERLPMRLTWIIKYLKYLNVTPNALFKTSLRNLTIGLFYILLFLTISRPAELLFTDKTEDDLIEVITTGLQWKDISFMDTDKGKFNEYIQIKIQWFKNQTNRNQPKIIDMQSPLCGDPKCNCIYFDFIKILRVLRQRRHLLIKKLEQINQQSSLDRTQEKQLRNLRTKPSNYIFVGQNGAIWSTYHLRPIMKQVQQVVGMKYPQAYPLYCIRIGAMSLVNQQKMDLLKVLRFVAWSINNLPHVSARYINFQSKELRTIPFEMIHGALERNGSYIDRSGSTLRTFDLADAKGLLFE